MRFFGFFLKDRLLRRGYMALDGPTATNEHHPDRRVGRSEKVTVGGQFKMKVGKFPTYFIPCNTFLTPTVSGIYAVKSDGS
ncbi:unnamed protein product [Nesidiocoris tenuis]|uniref:Uncharacterized protein n=1 Tax=Nesidiocoris tenuis TaxID=355587 RepID=A0A6H5HIF3_9HEMI|nr:unnamed protein product [Nesidiocoris tenuis]